MDLTKKFALNKISARGNTMFLIPNTKNLAEPLLAFHRSKGEFVETEVKENRVFSKVSNLELVETSKILRLFDPETNESLMTMEEMAAELERLKQRK